MLTDWRDWTKHGVNYLSDPDVSMVGGSWITTEDLVSKKDFAGITELAKSSLFLANNKE